MYYPNYNRERILHRKGFKHVAGIDEAGKGSWAGPIVAAAVILNPKIKIKGIKDSKKLRSPDRKELYEKIIKSATAYGVGIVDQKKIDEIGITSANLLAMQEALDKLKPPPNYVLIDAVKLEYKGLPTSSVIKGDYKITSVAAASIIAKVSRDQIMDELDEQFPAYGFKHHKGYGTNHHFAMLNKYGICDLHRKTWEPMKYLINR